MMDDSLNPNDEHSNLSAHFLAFAKKADESGDFLLSVYLYLAAFEMAAKECPIPSEDALQGLKQAWALACSHKERSMAEYIFELMEPYLSSEELARCADQLQSLAFDKLQEFGISRDELEDMAQLISSDLMGGAPPIFQFDKLMPGLDPAKQSSADKDGEDKMVDVGDTPLADLDTEEINPFFDEEIDYSSIAGYAKIVGIMRDLGIGMSDDPAYSELVNMLNARHGLSSKPALDSILFQSRMRDDANLFMVATANELKLPTIHMRMERNFQGIPMLCIATKKTEFNNAASMRDIIKNGGLVMLEDLDLWESPIQEPTDEPLSFIMSQLTRGAREAVGLIRAAVDNPNVYVLATAATDQPIDEFFLEALEPLTVIDIELPNAEERMDIWMDVAKEHPSIRAISKRDLVRFSSNLTRADIYMAARDAVDEAYKMGLMTRRYQPVTRENLFEKLAAYQPLESKEYSSLEEEVVKNFQSDLDHLDDLLN